MIICPNCGCHLELALEIIDPNRQDSVVSQRSHEPRQGVEVHFKMARQLYQLSVEDIIRSAGRVRPGTIQEYFTLLTDGKGHERRFPIKQIVRDALQTNYPNFTEEGFTSHRARDILRRLGIQVLKSDNVAS